MLCGAALIASSVAYAGDAVSDKEMADRYSQAALSGDSDAQFYLASLYSSGVGRPRSDEEAFRWFSRAADQGHSHAMLVLSGIYAVGRGIPKDNFNAYKWAYIVSVGSRVDEFRNGSRQLMGVLETRMTRDDVDRAKAEAGRWHATSSQPKPATAPAPTDSLTRDYQPSPQLSPAVSRQPPGMTSNNSTVTGSLPGPRNTSEKKNDMDALLDRVPSGLRKRFGF
jgi:TPR repeat protein